MRLIFSVLIASVIAITSVGVSAQPAEAGWVDGWFTFGGRTATMTRTFKDGSPARTPVVLYLKKKAGSQKCRARVIMRSGGYIWKSNYLYKYTRNRTTAFSGVVSWPNRVKRTTVTVKTNGRCIYRVFAK